MLNNLNYTAKSRFFSIWDFYTDLWEVEQVQCHQYVWNPASKAIRITQQPARVVEEKYPSGIARFMQIAY